MISYDDLWSNFLNKTGMHNEEIPNEEEEIKKEIVSSIRNFNVDSDMAPLKYDNELEEIYIPNDKDEELKDKILEVLTLIIEAHLQTVSLEYYQSVWQFDEKELKSKNYRDSVSARQANILKKEERIAQIFSYTRSYDFNS